MTYIDFILAGASSSGKTKRWVIKSISGDSKLGDVEWYGPWRQYVFFTEVANAVFSAGCLKDIAEFLTIKNKEQRERVTDESGKQKTS